MSVVTDKGIDALIHFLSGLGCSVPIDTGLRRPSAHSPSTIAGELFNDSESHASLAGTANPEPVHYDDKDQCFIRDVVQMLLSATAHSRRTFMLFCVHEVFTSVAGVPDPVLLGTAQSGRLICGHLSAKATQSYPKSG
ncbi:unnamed protein product [Dicrocoelium dendriticum]|nr:unnamed protein product [Dicrocoelium dendriticum]